MLARDKASLDLFWLKDKSLTDLDKMFGLLKPKEAFAGFGSDTVLTLASLFILTRVLLRAGVIEWIGQALARRARNATAMLRGMGAEPVQGEPPQA